MNPSELHPTNKNTQIFLRNLYLTYVYITMLFVVKLDFRKQCRVFELLTHRKIRMQQSSSYALNMNP